MNRIEEKFINLRKDNRKALVIFITAGDPDLETTKELVLGLAEAGADIIELGIPFSDPLADGPVLQKSAYRAIKNGASLKKILEMVRELRQLTQIPIVFMSSYNPIFHYNDKIFIDQAKANGVDGMIIPDLPPEESSSLQRMAEEKDLAMIYLLAPTSSPERIRTICRLSRGFIYYISLTGVTGVRNSLAMDLTEKIGEIKKITEKPTVIGFGISTPEQAKAAVQIADGVVIGSAVVRIVEENISDRKLLLEKTIGFVREIKEQIAS